MSTFFRSSLPLMLMLATPAVAQSPPPGSWTIIAHGRSGTAYADLIASSGWMRRMAERIRSLDAEGDVNVYSMNAADFSLTPLGASTLPSDSTRHHVVLFDWTSTSNILCPDGPPHGYSYAAGDAMYAFIRAWGIEDDVQLLLGYSRGAMLCSEASRRMILDGHPPTQVMYLEGEGWGPEVAITCPYEDFEFDAWASGGATRFDNVYTTYNDFVCTFVDLGGHHRDRCRNRNLGTAYSHSGGSFCPEASYEFIIDNLTFGAAHFELPGTWTEPTLTPLDPASEPAPYVYNGDFEWASAAGWQGFGGAPGAAVTVIDSTNAMMIDDVAPVATHNLLFAPNSCPRLRLNVRVPAGSSGSSMNATMHHDSLGSALIGQIDFATLANDVFVPRFFDIPPDWRGSVSTISFELVNPAAAGAYIDDVRIDCDARTTDINDDGVVDVLDLLGVLGAWGACPPPCPPQCAGDTDGDCAVDVIDLLAVLGDWG